MNLQNIWKGFLALLTLGIVGGGVSNQAQSILSGAQQRNSALPVIAEAPELHEGIWLNTNVPLKLEHLRGQVVLLEMWTFGCINCIRTIPYVREWHETYAEEGLTIIGNHYPEFNFEHDLDNVREAIIRLDVPYAILQDNDRETWGAYNNRFWPTIYLIDKWGNIRYRHIGEGRYDETEEAIQLLLAEPYEADPEAELDPIWSLEATEELNVRRGPGTENARIGWIQPGEAYYVLEETSNGWYRILFDGETAYVSGDYVTVSGRPE